MGFEDAIGVVRKHRWASLAEQSQRLEGDGCRVIVDLDKTDRDWLLTGIRERTVVKLAYACLLTPRQSVRLGLKDYERFAAKLSRVKRPAGVVCVGVVKDLDTGLVADSPGTRKAMLSVVREQLMRSHRGLAISEAARRGPKALVLTELQDARGEAIWRNVRRFPNWEDAETELQTKVHEGLTRWQAHKRWGPRETQTER